MQGFRSYSSYRKQRQKKSPVSTVIKYILAVLFILVLLQGAAFQLFYIGTDEMEPNYEKGSRFISFPYGLKNPFTGNYLITYHLPERGETAVVTPSYLSEGSPMFYNADFLLRLISFQKLTLYYRYPQDNPRVLLRVIGLPGDELYIEENTAYIREKGSSEFVPEFDISDQSYSVQAVDLPDNWNGDGPFGSDFSSITLKENEYFLLADDRGSIDDSRFWGPVPLENFRSRFGIKYWPLQ